MSEARADIPPASPAASAMGLSSGLQPPSPAVGGLQPPGGNQGSVGAGGVPNPIEGQSAPMSPRDQVKAKLIAAGWTPAGAEGTIRAGEQESGPGLNPREVGDGGTSFGAWQEHNDRALRLLDFARSQKKSPSDLMVQTDNLIREAKMGGDPIATQHRDLFMKASDPEAARAAFRQYFERPASLGAQMMTPVNGSAIRQRMEGFSQDVAAQAEADRREYERIRSESDPGSAERKELLDEARARAAHYRDMYEDFTKHPPAEKPIDALQNFGSIGTVLALLIGGMGRHHMNGALMAAGGMMQAANANDHEKFERQYKIWDHQSNMALNLSHLESDEVRNLLEDKRMSENDRQARLHAFFEEHQMTNQAQQLRAGMLEHVAQMEQTAQLARERLAASSQDFKRMWLAGWLQTDEGKKATPEQVEAKARSLGLFGGGAAAAGGAGLLSDETASQMADQYIAGDKSVLQGLGYGNVGAANRAKVRTMVSTKEMKRAIADFKTQVGRDPTDEEKEQLSSDIGRRLALAMAEFSGLQAGERSAFARIAGLTTAAAEAEKFTPLAVDASHKVSRTQYPTLNKIILAAEEGTGNEDVINLSIAANSLADAFAQVIGRGSAQMTDAARTQALNMLQVKWSQGQFDTAVKALEREIKAAQEAPEEVLKRFRNTFGLGEGATPLAGEVKPFSSKPGATATQALPKDLPDPTGHAEGSVAKENGKPVAVIRNGQWAPP